MGEAIVGAYKLSVIVVIPFGLMMSACATAPITDFASPASISIRYDPFLVRAAEVGVEAQAHCQEYNKNAAVTDRSSLGGGWEVMTFDCR